MSDQDDRRVNSLEALLTAVGRLEGKMDSQQGHIIELNTTIIKQNSRIGKLEQWRNGIVVAIAIGAFTISVFGGRIWDAFQNNRWKASDQQVYAHGIEERLGRLEKGE